MPIDPGDGPPSVSDVLKHSSGEILRARCLIQMKLSELPELIAIASQEMNRPLSLESDGDRSSLHLYFADPVNKWSIAFDLWENELAESEDNKYYCSMQLDREYGYGWVFRPKHEVDHKALLTYFEVEALLLPFEKGLLNLRIIFDQIRSIRERIKS